MTGSTDRDLALAAALEALPAPDHAEGFWDTLATRLVDQPAPDGLGPHPVRVTDPGTVDPGRRSVDPARATRSRRRPRPLASGFGGRRWLLVAAAVVLVGGIGLGVMVGSFERGRHTRIETIDPAVTTTPPAPPVSDPTPPDDGTTSTTGTVPAQPALGGPVSLRLGSAVELGSGLVDGLTDDGRSAYVWVPGSSGAAANPDLPCLPQGRLYLQPLGSAQRTRVGQPGQPVGPGLIVGPGGRIALISQCEALVGPMAVAQGNSQGVLSGVKVFSLNPGYPADDTSVRFDWLRTVQWTRDGSALLMATGVGAYRVDLATVATGPDTPVATGTDLGLGRVVALGQGRNGALAVVLADGRVQLDGVTLGTVMVDPSEENALPFNIDRASFGISRVAVDDRGQVWVASLRQGLVRLAPGHQPVVVDTLPAGDVAAFGGGVLWKAVTGGPTATDQGEIRTFGPNGVITLARDSTRSGNTYSLDPTGRAVLRVSSSDGFKTVRSAALPVEAGG